MAMWSDPGSTRGQSTSNGDAARHHLRPQLVRVAGVRHNGLDLEGLVRDDTHDRLVERLHAVEAPVLQDVVERMAVASAPDPLLGTLVVGEDLTGEHTPGGTVEE